MKQTSQKWSVSDRNLMKLRTKWIETKLTGAVFKITLFILDLNFWILSKFKMKLNLKSLKCQIIQIFSSDFAYIYVFMMFV